MTESLNKEINESNILDAIIVFIRHEYSDVAYAGHALILNILTSHGGIHNTLNVDL